MNANTINRDQRKARSCMGHMSLGARECCAPIPDHGQDRPFRRAGFLPMLPAVSGRSFALRFVPIAFPRRTTSLAGNSGQLLCSAGRSFIQAGAGVAATIHLNIKSLHQRSCKFPDAAKSHVRLSVPVGSSEDQHAWSDRVWRYLKTIMRCPK